MNDSTATETKLAFLEKAHDDLNEVVLRQQAEIRRLAVLVEALRDRVRALSDSGGENLPDPSQERPPHY